MGDFFCCLLFGFGFYKLVRDFIRISIGRGFRLLWVILEILSNRVMFFCVGALGLGFE